jgi:hypothetical protein
MKVATRLVTVSLIVLALAATCSAKSKREPLSTVSFVVVRDENGKPIRDAAVVLHPVGDNGKQKRGGFELKTDADGKTSYDGVPYGKLRIQVLANGFQTYGDDFDVTEPNLDITVKMKRPAKQYSIYEDHPATDKKDQTPPEQNPKPQQ